jgi:hypothetical protein
MDIAKRTPVLLRLLEENPNNVPMAELTISVISHSAATILETDKPPDSKLFKILDVPRILRLLITNIAKPTSTSLLIGHASQFFVYAPWTCAKEILAYPSAINYMVALTRSEDFLSRWSAMTGLLRVGLHNAEKEDVNQDPRKLMSAVQRGTPDHLSDVMMQYGSERCDMFLLLSGARDYRTVMMQLVQDHDFVKLGQALARLILVTEYSISDGNFQTVDPRTGRPIVDNLGLSFSRHIDALPLCAAAPRRTGNPENIDKADIIECKNALVRGQVHLARQHANQASQRNPRVGYRAASFG